VHAANAVQRALAAKGASSAEDAWRRATRDSAAEARIGREQAPADEGDAGPTPIFLVGEACCGAELAEAMLAAEPGVFAAGEINLFHGAVARELARAGRGEPVSIARLTEAQRALARDAYLDRARRIAPEAQWFVDRSRDLAMHVGALRALFPEARIIRLERSALRQGFDVYRRYRPNADARSCDLLAIGRDLRAAQRGFASLLRRTELEATVVDTDELAAEPINAGPKLRAAAGLPVQLSAFSSPRVRRAAAALAAVDVETLEALHADLTPLRRGLKELARG
jgi:hypothetical protein